MKVFQEYEKFVAYAFTRPDSSKIPGLLERYGISAKTLTINSVIFSGMYFLILFILDEAETLQEYSETVYALTTLASITSGFVLFEWRQIHLFGSIDAFQNIIESRT